MAGTNSVGYRLSVLAMGAGTILGLSSSVLAQSRQEKRVEVRVEDGGQKSGQKQFRVHVGGGEGQPEKRIERRVEVLGGGEGGACPMCGHGGEGKGAGKGNVKVEKHVQGKAIVVGPDGQKREFNFGGEDGDGPHVFRLHGGEGGRWMTGPDSFRGFKFDDGTQNTFRRFRMEGGGEGEKVIKLRKGGPGGGIMVRPHGGHGEHHEFKFEGGDIRQLHEHMIELRGGHAFPEGEFRTFKFDGGGGGEGGERVIKLRKGGGGGQGGGHGGVWMSPKGGVSGKVIIVGPDGQRREMDFGGDEGEGVWEINDGDAHSAHQKAHEHLMKVRRIHSGGLTL